MKTGTVTLATLAAAALALAAAGCGDKCNDQTPPVKAVPDCEVVEGTAVTVPVQVCPRCDQASPRCIVHVDATQIQLEPLSEVCDPSSSCPIVDPVSCQFAPLSCTFTAPPASADPYQIVVVTPDGGSKVRDLTVLAVGSSPANCGLPY